jgi:hypothetical protein
MENFARKISPWVPLLIAAGYFLFLVATWAKMSQTWAAQVNRLKEQVKDEPAPGNPDI